MLDPYLVIGEVLKPQGIKGELKVRPITCLPERFDGMAELFLRKGDDYLPCETRVTRIGSDAVYLTLDGVRNRTEAEALRGELLYVDREHAVQLPEDTEFICDLIGCVATDDLGHEIGALCDVLQPGAADVYVFRGVRGEIMVPALKSVVLEVDVREKRMVLSAKRLAEVAVFDAD